MTVNGAGSDIWGIADSFHFVYQPFHDSAISVDSPQQDGTNAFAKAGLMIRLSLDPGSPHVILDVRPDGNIEFMTRQTQDGPTTFMAGGRAPGQLRLVRSNGTVTGLLCPFIQGYIPCVTIGSTPFPSGAALAGAVVTSHDPSTLNHATFGSGMPSVFPVPAPWFSLDVGTVGIPGNAFLDNGTFTITGAGADIWGTSDSFQFVKTGATDDGEVVARVTSEDAANTYAKAGVIMTASGNNATVILDVRPNGIIEFMARSSNGAPMQFIAGSAASFPVWLKLERRGSQFTGSMSQDGTQWTPVGITSLLMNRITNAGLAVTSHDTAALNTATFDHVLVASAAPIDTDIGDVGIAGQFWPAPDDSYFQVIGSGADIWGTADAFQFFYESLIDDGQMVVRINSLENTATFAKAGLMIRESLDPSAAHVLIDVTPSGLIELLTRESTGAETRWIGGLSPRPFPVWLKISRSGTRITASASSDGSTWQDVGTAFNTQLPSDSLIGVAVTSHHRGVITTATFSNMSR